MTVLPGVRRLRRFHGSSWERGVVELSVSVLAVVIVVILIVVVVVFKQNLREGFGRYYMHVDMETVCTNACVVTIIEGRLKYVLNFL
jgi:ABC-type sulfate transport system permease subunit